MNDGSDHQGSPEQRRLKRQRINRDGDAPPILTFDTMGPDETTADLSDDPNERSDQPAEKAQGPGSVVQTTEEIGRLQMENVRLLVELNELRKQLRALQEQHEQMNSLPVSTTTYRDAPADIEREYETLRSEHTQAIEELKKIRSADELHTTEREQLKQENLNLKTSYLEAQELSNELRRQAESQNMSSRSQMQALEAEVQRSRKEIDDLKEKAEQANRANPDSETLLLQIRSLEKELQKSQAVRSQLDELETANATLQVELNRKEKEIFSIRRRGDADARLNQENEELKNMLVDLGVKNHERERELESVLTIRDELDAQLKDAHEELRLTKDENLKQSDRITSLEVEAKSAQVQLGETSHRLNLLEESLELKESQNAELLDKAHHLTVRGKEQQEMIHHLNVEHDHLKRLNDEFKERAAQQDITITEQRAEIRSLQHQCANQAQSLEELQQEHQELEGLAQSRSRKLEARERQVNDLHEHSERLQSRVSELEENVAVKTHQLEKQVEAAWQQKRTADEEQKRILNEHNHAIEALKYDHNEELSKQLGMQQRLVEDLKNRELEMSDKYDKEVQRLRAQLASLKAQTSTADAEYHSTKALLDDTKAQLSRTHQALEDLQARVLEERSRYASEKNRLEHHTSDVETRNSKLQAETDELRRKDKAMNERLQSLEQTIVDLSVELRQVKAPRSSDSGIVSNGQDTVSEAEALRREFTTQNTLWERMRDEMIQYINRINGENTSLRSELDRWQAEEGQRMQTMEESLKRKFLRQTEQLESLASFKENAQNSLVNVAQEDLRKLTDENLAMRREHVALYERAEMLEIRANQAVAELSRTHEELNNMTAQLKTVSEQDENLRNELKQANETLIQKQNRILELENELKNLHVEIERRAAEVQNQLDQSKTALQASETTAQNLRIRANVMESQQKSQAEATIKYVDMLFFIMKVDRRRIQDLTFVKKHLMLYFPPPVGVFPTQDDPRKRKKPRTLYDVATFALAIVRFRRNMETGSRQLATEYEKQLRAVQ